MRVRAEPARRAGLRRPAGQAALAALLGLKLACQPAPPAPPAPPVPVWEWGARVIQADGVRRFDPGRPPVLELAVEDARGFGLRFASRPLPTSTRPQGDRWILRAEVPAGLQGAGWLEVHDAAGAVRARLEARFQAPPPTADEVPAAAPAEAKAWAASARGRAAWRRGDLAAAGAAWAEAEVHAAAAGLASEVRLRRLARAEVALRQHQLNRADALIAAAAAGLDPAGDPLGALRVDQVRANLAHRQADWRGVERFAKAVMDAAARSGDLQTAADGAMLLAEARLLSGRPAEALALYAAHIDPVYADPEGAPYPRAIYLKNRGWTEAAAADRQVPGADFAAAEARMEAALALDLAREDGPQVALSRLNLAWLAWRAGRLEGAAARLEAVDRAALRGEAPLTAAWLDAELAPPAAAEAAFQALAAQAAGWPGGDDYRWRAALGQARIQWARGDQAAARASGLAGLEALEQAALSAPLRAGLAPFFADRRALVDLTLELLLAGGEAAQAFQVAARASARVVQALEIGARIARQEPAARARWQAAVGEFQAAREALEAARAGADLVYREVDKRRLAAEEARLRAARAEAFNEAYGGAPAPALDAAAVQRALAEGEALVLFAPQGPGWIGFWLTAHSLRAAPVAPGDPLAAFPNERAAARHLYLVTGGLPGAFDLPTRGSPPLAADLSLSLLPHPGLLSRRPAPAHASPLVIADPTRDLAGAAAEGQRIRALLPTARLLEGDAAQRAAVLTALDGAAVVHYAGHGELHPDDPWAAHLRLADGARLALEDLLVHRPATGLVVLSGCQTGARLTVGGGEVVGLPEALLLAGGGAVLATTRDLEDREALAFLERFYRAGGARQPGAAFQAAVAASEAAGDPAWRAFRLWGRPAL